jgi:hypothetical protein
MLINVDGEYFFFPATHPRVETVVPAARPKPGLYWVFPTHAARGPLHLHRLNSYCYLGLVIGELRLMPSNKG